MIRLYVDFLDAPDRDPLVWKGDDEDEALRRFEEIEKAGEVHGVPVQGLWILKTKPGARKPEVLKMHGRAPDAIMDHYNTQDAEEELTRGRRRN